jgi:hypothetical protein
MALFDKRLQYTISSTGLIYFISVFLCSFISVLSFDENITPPHEWFVELSSMIGFSLIISSLILFVIVWNYFKDKTLFKKKNIYHYFLFFILIFISSSIIFPILVIQTNENVFEKKLKIVISTFSFISFISSLIFLFYFFINSLDSYTNKLINKN